MPLSDLEQRALDCFVSQKTPNRKKVVDRLTGDVYYCNIREGKRVCCMQGELLVIYRSPAQEHCYYACNKSFERFDI